MNWNLYFSFEGRASRSDYWLRFVLPYIAIIIGLSLIDGMLGLAQDGVGLLSTLFMLVAIWPSLALAIKRFHDRDKSGWWVLITLVPIIGSIWFFVEAGCLRGTVGSNRFGADPVADSTTTAPAN